MIKILYVEDEADLREALAEELEEEGFDVRVACNGEEGLRVLVDFKPDLVITDWLMPRMTGIELIRTLRTKLPAFAFTPVIFLSAYSAKSHVDEAMAAGACRYLTKPVDYDKLLRAIAAFSEAPAKPSSPQCRCHCHSTVPMTAGSN